MEGRCLLAHPASFLTQPRPMCPGMALPTVEWALQHQSSVKKMLHRCPQANQMEAILHFCSFFPGMSFASC
ncbi:hypothetical protein I79_007279 [Cricetulus griseus]|uniref:Uncharacterized protein n=1 Tax=Cricetulus griseus TaxID=10029 RepID=G3HA37_CRIGR|nr:hypothetical protein I79_007279 [Cricetulus griseus]